MKRDLHKTLSTLIIVLCLATVTSCILPYSNLITNPSFEKGITGWSVGGSGHVNIVIEGNASDGSFAANFSRGDTPVGSTLSQTITTQVGKLTNSVSMQDHIPITMILAPYK